MKEIIEPTKEIDLKNLKGFSSQEKVQGFVSNLWFAGLRSRYPIEYLYYSQHKNGFNIHQTQALVKLKNNLSLSIDKIFARQINQEEVDKLNHILKTLSELSNKK